MGLTASEALTSEGIDRSVIDAGKDLVGAVVDGKGGDGDTSNGPQALDALGVKCLDAFVAADEGKGQETPLSSSMKKGSWLEEASKAKR